MITHDLKQGSPAWLAHRRKFRNASDAAAMMGCSPHKTRTQLMHEIWAGEAAEPSQFVQDRIYDPGHEFEALCRPLAELVMGERLYPVVGTKGLLSASFDGLVMDETRNWEHKRLNEILREAMFEGCTGLDLPLYHQVQMEQQCIVADCVSVLFSASEWRGTELVEVRHCWYERNPELAKQIEDGWAQFEKDLAVYVPQEVIEKPVAAAIMVLPSLDIAFEGKVTRSNLALFKAEATKFIDAIKTDLETDQDFVDADSYAKACEAAEKDIQRVRKAAINSSMSVGEVIAALDAIEERLRSKRLLLAGKVVSEKNRIKQEAIAEMRLAFHAHVTELNKTVAPLFLAVVHPDFDAASYKKRTVATLKNALNTALAAGKIAADNMAEDYKAKLEFCKANAKGYSALFPDLQLLIAKPMDDFKLVVTTRVDARKAADQKLIDDAAAHAKAKADKEAADKLAAEAAAAAPVHVEPEAELQAELLTDGAQVVDQAEPIAAPAPAPATPVRMVGRRAGSAMAPAPGLSLDKLNALLGFTLNPALIANLGISPQRTVAGVAVYRESEFDDICDRLKVHVSEVQAARRIELAA